jgi:hypothetical protein
MDDWESPSQVVKGSLFFTDKWRLANLYSDFTKFVFQ